jgi:hypothetical protein
MGAVQLLRQHHDAERFVLSVWELREYERVQLGRELFIAGSRATFLLGEVSKS